MGMRMFAAIQQPALLFAVSAKVTVHAWLGDPTHVSAAALSLLYEACGSM